MFILVIAGSGLVQDGFYTVFPNNGGQGKKAFTAPGNQICLPYSATTFDFDQAANTHTTDNWRVPFPCEVTQINYACNAAQAFTDDNLDIALVVPANNVTTVANAIAAFRFADGPAAGDVATGVYQSALDGSIVLAADTLYEVGVIVRPTGGIVTAVTKGIHVWVRPIPNTED